VGYTITTNLYTIRPNNPVELAADVMHWTGFQHVPIETDAGEPVGILTPLSMADVEPVEDMTVADVMLPPPPIVSATAPLGEAVAGFLEAAGTCVFVETDGRLVGLLTGVDLERCAAEMAQDSPDGELPQLGERDMPTPNRRGEKT